jgi:DNA-binding NarL/FixJ family response regulator
VKSRTRVLLADDSPSITELYESLVGREDDLECVGTLDSASDLEGAITRLRPDVVVVDLTMPGKNPVEAIRDAAVRFPDCRFIAFSGYDDPQTRDEVLGAGACALVSKHDDPTRLVEEIRRVRGTEPAAGAP